MFLTYATLGALGFAAGASVTRFFPDCHEAVCWPGVSPFLLMFIAGTVSARSARVASSPGLSASDRGSQRFGAVTAGAVGGALTGIFVSLGVGLVMVLEARPYCCGPKSFWSPIVLTAVLGAVLGLFGVGLYGLIRHVRVAVS